MADICRQLGIVIGGDACTTCLPLHVFISLIENDIVSIGELIKKQGKFVKGLLNSQYIRDGYPTLVRIIDKIEHRTFTVLDRYFGTLGKKTAFIVRLPWHFFIAKRLEF